MADLLSWLVILLVAGGAGFWLVQKKAAEQRAREERRAALQAEAAEEERREACSEVVLFYANHLGYIARDVVGRDELEAMIESGASADALSDFIASRCATVDGIQLGRHPVAGASVPVILPPSFRERHLYIVGKSGSGKTTLIRNLILQDLAAGHGLAVIAPEQEMLTEEILPFIPADRLDDVVYVNPADTDRPVPFNPLHLDPGEDLDLKVAETLTVFQRIFDDDAGGGAPRMETILRQALYTLMQIPGSTLLDIEKLLDRQDPAFREWAISKIGDEDARRFWTSTYPAYPKDAHLSVVNRLSRFLRPKVVRSLLCSPGRSFDIRGAMDSGKVLLFSLSDGILGESNAQVIGQLVVAKLQMAAMSRANAPKHERRPFHLYIDEFQSFCGVAATSYEKILSRARKYGLSLILAHQQTGQIPENLMREILGNVSTLVAFSVGASDARRLGREMVGELDGETVPLDPQALLSLRVGETWCRIGRNVFFMATAPAPERGSAAVREEGIQRSRQRYGASSAAPSMPGRATVAAAVTDDEKSIEDIDPGRVF
jgi:hypothetical protein